MNFRFSHIESYWVDLWLSRCSHRKTIPDILHCTVVILLDTVGQEILNPLVLTDASLSFILIGRLVRIEFLFLIDFYHDYLCV